MPTGFLFIEPLNNAESKPRTETKFKRVENVVKTRKKNANKRNARKRPKTTNGGSPKKGKAEIA